jgi:hypothetical protein
MVPCEQQTLGLFPERTFEQILKAENLENRLIVRPSSRMVRGWNVTLNRITGKRTLIIPESLFQSPEPIKIALISWALLPLVNKKNKSKELQNDRKKLENYVYQHLNEYGLLKPSISKLNREKLADKTTGNKYDLHDIFVSLNNLYFDNKIQAYLRWGTPGSTTSYQTIRRSKDGICWNLITIADIYNHPSIPQFAIESVMFHEMLHIAIPPYRKNGKNVIHGKEFKTAEKMFPLFEQWRAWENSDLRELLKVIKKKKRKPNLFF